MGARVAEPVAGALTERRIAWLTLLFGFTAAAGLTMADQREWAAGLAIGTVLAWLNFRWDANAYGSIVWLIIGLHTTHIVTDVVDTIVLAVLMFTRHARPRRFSDVTDNVFYWVFVVATWLPLYVLIYWAPRWMG